MQGHLFTDGRFGTVFGLIAREPEDDGDDWWIILEPGDYMAFSPLGQRRVRHLSNTPLTPYRLSISAHQQSRVQHFRDTMTVC